MVSRHLGVLRTMCVYRFMRDYCVVEEKWLKNIIQQVSRNSISNSLPDVVVNVVVVVLSIGWYLGKEGRHHAVMGLHDL